jgi:hypothetical protein
VAVTGTVTDVAVDLYLPDPSLGQTAQRAIDEFEQSSTSGVWASLDKATVVAELRSRVSDPFQISQGAQPFCGPAAVLFELVRKQPTRYVQLCQSLFETGQFQGTTHLIQASEALRQNRDQNLRMGQADWMVLATLRESENVLFPVEPNAPDLIRDLAGMTKSWEIKGWIHEILGYSQSEYHPAYLLSDFGALNASVAALRSGGVAFMLVTAVGMLEGSAPPVPFPSHWVALLGNVAVGDRVSFDLYTWSKKLHVDLDVSSFKQYFWASVTGVQ